MKSTTRVRARCREVVTRRPQSSLLIGLQSLLLLWAVCSTSPSIAATVPFVQITDPSSPGGFQNVTRDTSTNLDWLDWTASESISYDNMLTMLKPGGTFQGWRHATRDEVRVFMSHATLPVGNWPATSSVQDVIPAGIFRAAVGVTIQGLVWEPGTGLGSWAFTATPASATEQYATRAYYTTGGYSETRGDEFFARSVVPNVGAGIGHALVRAVPEPSSVVICLLGLVIASCGFPRTRLPAACRKNDSCL